MNERALRRFFCVQHDAWLLTFMSDPSSVSSVYQTIRTHAKSGRQPSDVKYLLF